MKIKLYNWKLFGNFFEEHFEKVFALLLFELFKMCYKIFQTDAKLVQWIPMIPLPSFNDQQPMAIPVSSIPPTHSSQSSWIFLKSESEVAQSCPTLCDPMDGSLSGSSFHGIFQARILEWIAISFSRRSSWPRDWTWISCIVGRRFTVWATKEDILG